MSFGAVQLRAVDFRTESRITIASSVSEVWAYMRATSRELFKSRIQRVSDIEMIAIKAAVESTMLAGTS